MSKKQPPSDKTRSNKVQVSAVDIVSVTVSEDGRDLASIIFELSPDSQLEILLSPPLLAKIEGMLTRPGIEQAKRNPVQ